MSPQKKSSRTFSLCPVCLQKIGGIIERHGTETILRKICPQHGEFYATVWKDLEGVPAYSAWNRPKIPFHSGNLQSISNKGCPFDCGLCPSHNQRTCTALIEITSRCNLNCPVCFASSGKKGKDLELSTITCMLKNVHQQTKGCNLQLSGGEPSLHPQLTEIIRIARKTGFTFIQLNSNGLRLAKEPGFCEQLATAGLDSVFLQFDGMNDRTHLALRGKELTKIKTKAIEHLKAAGIGIVLVPVVVSGINENQIWDIVRYGLECGPQVRGVHFQPISYFGRFPEQSISRHFTLPELMSCLEKQSSGMIKASDFIPPGCEHALCSFSARYLRQKNGSLVRLGNPKNCNCQPQPALQGALRSIKHTARQWGTLEKETEKPPAKTENELDHFLRQAKTSFQISAMAFMDAWNLDLTRLQGCCIHIAQTDGRLIPFCAANITSLAGTPLYKRTK